MILLTTEISKYCPPGGPTQALLTYSATIKCA